MYADVAVISKARLNDKGFVVRRTAGLSFTLGAGDEVFFVPPQLDVPRRGIVNQVSEIDERTYEVRFGDTVAVQAQSMVGMHCLIDAQDRELPGSDDSLYNGFLISDEAEGSIGTVVELDTASPQERLIVQSEEYGEVIIPFVDEIVVAVDEEACQISVRLPRGLLEL